MKHLFVWYSPTCDVPEETQKLFDLQVDNSLELGWKPEDILPITNKPYEYRGVKSLVVDNSAYCDFRPGSTKTTTVAWMLEQGLVNPGEIYWAHDPDCFQVNVITEEELGMENADVAFTTYGWSPKWCMGSFFFKDTAKDIFKWIRDTIYEIHNEDERALVKLTKENFNNINSRIKPLNITYQIGMRNIESNYEKADKPIRAVHFRPYYNGKRELLEKFMYGKNRLGFPIMTERLINLFHKYGIK